MISTDIMIIVAILAIFLFGFLIFTDLAEGESEQLWPEIDDEDEVVYQNEQGLLLTQNMLLAEEEPEAAQNNHLFKSEGEALSNSFGLVLQDALKDNPRWNELEDLYQKTEHGLEAIEKLLSAGFEQKGFEELLIKKALLCYEEGEEYLAIQILGDLILDTSSSENSRELAKLALHSILGT